MVSGNSISLMQDKNDTQASLDEGYEPGPSPSASVGIRPNMADLPSLNISAGPEDSDTTEEDFEMLTPMLKTVLQHAMRLRDKHNAMHIKLLQARLVEVEAKLRHPSPLVHKLEQKYHQEKQEHARTREQLSVCQYRVLELQQKLAGLSDGEQHRSYGGEYPLYGEQHPSTRFSQENLPLRPGRPHSRPPLNPKNSSNRVAKRGYHR